jgi:hypothetical protein
MCRVIMDYVTGKGFEPNNGTQACGYQRSSMLLLSVYGRKVGFAALRGPVTLSRGAALGRFMIRFRTALRESPFGRPIRCFRTTQGAAPACQLPAGSR